MGKMPVLFVGHGSPMNAIEDNVFSTRWKSIAAEIPQPKAILAVSAHWFSHGFRVCDTAQPRLIYDMYGFPKALYEVLYPVKGAPDFAAEVLKLGGGTISADNSWGIDHGAWSVLCRMYPAADVPVFQVSVSRDDDARAHFDIGKQLAALRAEGVLIFASGNVVHNLARVDWDLDGGYDWAEEFDGTVKNAILRLDFDAVVHAQTISDAFAKAVPTPDHFLPLVTALGAADAQDEVQVFNNACTMGSLSMTSYLFR
ncbi:MAG: 4,5-DOPA dioxygenase extradiol [Oscillospiraceae bacterium]